MGEMKLQDTLSELRVTPIQHLLRNLVKLRSLIRYVIILTAVGFTPGGSGR
jgi:hypothetical protein